MCNFGLLRAEAGCGLATQPQRERILLSTRLFFSPYDIPRIVEGDTTLGSEPDEKWKLNGTRLLFLWFRCQELVVAPRAGLGAGNDAGDVGIFSVGAPGARGLPAFGLFASPGFFLLAFLFRALARALLLSYFGSIRHRQVPFQIFAAACEVD